MKISKWVMPHWLPIMRVIEFIGVLAAIFVVLWDFTVERPVDRAVRKATLFAQMAQTHALQDGAGLKALRPTILALLEEGIPLENQILSSVDLSSANLRKAQFPRSDLTGAILWSTDLTGAFLMRANLTGANLKGADLTGANLMIANLTDADLTSADLTDADLTNANLSNAKLWTAELTDANLLRADLTGARLRGANLTNADLTNANLTGVNLRDANLTGANFEGVRELPDLSRACADPNNLPTGLTQEILNKITKPCPYGGQ